MIDDVVPDKATYRPGEPAHVTVTLTNDRAGPLSGRIVLALRHLDQEVSRYEQAVEVGPGPDARAEVAFNFTPPSVPFRGYGLDATLYDAGGQVLAEGSGALDVLEHWSQAPRYGFLSDFAPDQSDAEVQARCDSLCRYHLNVVQFYDWMWRHYKLLPPPGVEEFTDAMGRRLSLRSVKAAIKGVQARGGAAMAYGAVYGAEPEFATLHPELMLYDEHGEPISLDRLFYIMNIAPDSPWVPLIVGEFAEAVRVMGFDGIHLDQYGFPVEAVTAEGKKVELAAHFPPLIEAARTAVTRTAAEVGRSGAGVIFNAVGNWPIEAVAPTSQHAVYIEVWPPDESYNDLRRLIREGKRLSGGKQVILAAYLSPFADPAEETLPRAEAAALLATAVIAASGGSHLLLGERDGILCNPYYPEYARLRPAFARRMRAYYDFLVRYEELLVAPDLQDRRVEQDRDGQGFARYSNRNEDRESYSLQGVPWSTQAEAGKVWLIARYRPGYRIVHLINLADQSEVAWNAPRTPPDPLSNITLALDGLPPIRQAMLLTPDAHRGKPLPVQYNTQGHTTYIHIPRLDIWSVVACACEGDPA